MTLYCIHPFRFFYTFRRLVYRTSSVPRTLASESYPTPGNRYNDFIAVSRGFVRSGRAQFSLRFGSTSLRSLECRTSVTVPARTGSLDRRKTASDATPEILKKCGRRANGVRGRTSGRSKMITKRPIFRLPRSGLRWPRDETGTPGQLGRSAANDVGKPRTRRRIVQYLYAGVALCFEITRRAIVPRSHE